MALRIRRAGIRGRHLLTSNLVANVTVGALTKRELDYLSQREHKSVERVEKERWKDVALKIKDMYKNRKKR